MKEEINVYILKPGHLHVKTRIKNTLEEMQRIVEGYIEVYPVRLDGNTEVVIICNEEGKLMNLPYNCTINGEDFVGTIIFAGVSGEDFDDYPFRTLMLMR